VKVLNKSKINEALNNLAKAGDVYVPMQRNTQTGFFSWKTFDETRDNIALEMLNVLLPPKNIVLPQTEKMYSFKQEGQEINIDQVYENSSPKIIFGCRPCDVKAIECLDMVFLTKGYVDNFYQARRDSTTIIANACYTPGANCFCAAMGIDPVEPPADVVIRDIGEGWVWEVETEKGQKATDKIAAFLEDKSVKLPEPANFSRAVKYEGLAEKLKGLFEHPLWERLSDPCQTCGICTYLCPTCYCFDIQVKTWGEEGYRFRCYDSCMYREYTLMAGGHNPRETAKERFRNRFLHKLEFFKERYGTPLCTGCGRCTAACPNGISIVGVMDEIKEVETGA
jgi:sulfhydrogenase subunit beta (sulfur reductase)